MIDPPISISADESVIHVRFRGEATDLEYDRYLEQMTAALNSRKTRGRKWAMIHDATAGFKGSPEQHQRHSMWTRKHADLMKRCISVVLYVVPDPFVRTVLSSVVKLNPGPVPSEIHESLAQAQARVRVLARAV
jgi:hypothetical protein